MAEWYDPSLEIKVLHAQRARRETRVILQLTNVTENPFQVSFYHGENISTAHTYLVDDLGNRFPAIGGSLFRSGWVNEIVNLIPGVSVRAELAFDAVPREAHSVTIILAESYIKPGTFSSPTISVGPLELGP